MRVPVKNILTHSNNIEHGQQKIEQGQVSRHSFQISEFCYFLGQYQILSNSYLLGCHIDATGW